MFILYIKSAFRNFRRQPGYTFINFFGLSLGIACVILILSWVNFQFSFDNFHKNLENIYQVNAEVHWGEDPWIQTNHQAALAVEMKKRYPEIKEITRVDYTGDVVFNYQDKSFYENRIIFVDSSFFKIFTFPILSGSEKDFFSNPHSILFTETMAEKYFGDSNPVGKVIKFNKYNITVAGVIKDPPLNSSIRFNYIVPIEFRKEYRNDPAMDNDWGNWYLYSFLTLHENVDVQDFNSKIGSIYKDFDQVEDESRVLIHPLKDMRLDPPRLNFSGIDQMDSIYIVSFIALMILIVACINFMNLSTANYSGRAKDVGIRKTIGAKRKILINQFLTESFILAITGGLAAILISFIALPFFNELVDEQIEIQILNKKFIIGFIVIVLFSGILAGSYPSLYLSSFKPVKVLKGRLIGKKGKNNTRMVMVVFQFAIAIFLIVSALFSVKQLRYALHKDLGFNKEQVLYVPLNDNSIYHTLKQELLKNPDVANVSASNWWGFDNMNNSYGYDFPGKEEGFDVLLTFQKVDYDYIETLDIPILKGRSFSKDFKTDENRSYILNETAIKTFGIIDPIGSPFNLHGRQGEIVGVMKDVHFRTLFSDIDPRILRITSDDYNCVLIKIAGNETDRSSVFKKIKGIEKDWRNIVPGTPFDYQFLNDMYDRSYNQGRTNNRILTVFASLAIFISCIGLFGLAIYATEQKTKEIGVRKVNGAKVIQVISMLLNEFIRYVIIAFMVIMPLSYLFVKLILQIYTYQTDMSWWIFILAGGFVLIIALLTVGLQTWTAARKNPVEALRYE